MCDTGGGAALRHAEGAVGQVAGQQGACVVERLPNRATLLYSDFIPNTRPP
jgi:hypothetical protein